MRTPARIAAFGAPSGSCSARRRSPARRSTPCATRPDAATGTATARPARTGRPCAGGRRATPGLAVAEDGYGLAPTPRRSRSARTTELRFRILDPDGAPVTDFDVEHTGACT